MSDLELVLELLRRAGLLTKNVYVNLTFEDGRLKEVEVF